LRVPSSSSLKCQEHVNTDGGKKAVNPKSQKTDAMHWREKTLLESLLPETYATAPFRLFIFFLLIVKSKKKVMGCPENLSSLTTETKVSPAIHERSILFLA